ncbi:unnamed protein product [Lymnaea stagnalis]|uniref:Kazal-like domain-containing protein n=1 Tax=Lymnaea stagnalis TaxID=6523 RepID=A0AAV2IBX4_LYMST
MLTKLHVFTLLFTSAVLLGQTSAEIYDWSQCGLECYYTYVPLCGSDGITYRNNCFLLQANCDKPAGGKITQRPAQRYATAPAHSTMTRCVALTGGRTGTRVY